jgi:hypothetical protein
MAASVVRPPTQAGIDLSSPTSTAASASSSSSAAATAAATAAMGGLNLNGPNAGAGLAMSNNLSDAAALAARGLRTAFNVSHASGKSVAEIMTEVKRVINMNRIQCQFDSLWSPLGGPANQPTPTVLFCEKGPIRFEMEVTSVPAAPGGSVPSSELHVVRMKRVSGDSWAYKNLCNRIIPQLRL